MILAYTVRILIAIGLVLSKNIIIDYDSQSNDLMQMDFIIHTQLSCYELVVVSLVDPKETSGEEIKLSNDSYTCKFNYDKARQDWLLYMADIIQNYLQGSYSTTEQWLCNFKNTDLICDGSSECLSDECWCSGDYTTDVFYCSDGIGCVTFDKLCDDVQDCFDGSDECFCFESFVFTNTSLGDTKICLSMNEYCRYQSLEFGTSKEFESRFDCSSVNIVNTLNYMNPLYECFYDPKETMKVEFSKSPNLIPLYCRSNCSDVSGFIEGGWFEFCDRVKKGNMLDYEFACDITGPYSEYSLLNPHLSAVCDGKVDCKSGSDEMGCPGRFYCNPNETIDWVELKKVCDHVKDCSNGADECSTCDIENISSHEFLIRSMMVVVFTGIISISIITMNTIQIKKCWSMPCSSNIKQTEKIYLMNVFAHDLLMGLYLIGIFIAALVIRWKGKYCLLESMWRSSWICSAFGVLFSSSAHGSLLTIALMSITRYRVCRTVGLHIKRSSVVIVLVITNLLNWSHSLLPLLPIVAIQEIFRTEIFFKNLDINPFFTTNPINRSRLLMLYEGMFRHPSNSPDVYKILEDLKNVTSNERIFDTKEISYYGNTGLCMHNIFKSQGSYNIYKMSYCVCISIVLSIVSLTYLKILMKSRQSKKSLADSGGNKNSPTSSREKNFITLKIALIIGSQLACWISYISTIIFFDYIAKKSPSPVVFEIFALVVIPLNSFLNPVFYGEMYTKILLKVYGVCRST